MATNRTGLQKADGKPSDWIEIKHTGNSPVDLKGYKLAVAKSKEASADTVAKERAEKDKTGNAKEWEFPAHEIAARESLVVFLCYQRGK